MAVFLLIGLNVPGVVAAEAGRDSAQVAAPTTGQPPDTPEKAKKQEQEREPEPEPANKDQEDRWPARVLAVPEYLWRGFTYPFKELAIAYERHDLMNRALDVFLNKERTGGVYPRFSVGGTLSSGIGLTAFDNNLFHREKEVRLSYLVATRDNQVGEVFYRDSAVFGSKWFFESNAFWLNFDESHFFPGGNRAREQDQTNFELKQLAWDMKAGRPIIGDLSAALLGRLLIADAKPSSRLPATPTTVTGNDASMTALAVEPSLRYDSRDNQFRPTTGWLVDTGFNYTSQVNDDRFRYLGYWVEVLRMPPTTIPHRPGVTVPTTSTRSP